jgi:hypothetical protein
MSVRTWILALFLLVVAAGFVPTAVSAAGGPLLATVSGPSALAPGQTAVYNLTISGGPTGNVTYSVTYNIIGSNTTGGSPLGSSPGQKTGNGTQFQLNVTAPTLEQELTLSVKIVAAPRSGPNENTVVTYAISVVKPFTLTATFHNSGTTAAVNVTVRWYVDGVLVGTSVLQRIAANADATVTLTFLPAGLSAGEHALKVSADLDHDGVINAARGEVVTSTIFYNQVQQPPAGWAVLLGMGVFIPVFLGVVAWRRRGER